MPLKFNEKKATQAAALFLKANQGAIDLLKLVKLVYLADRTALIEGGRPITFDTWFSMQHGPVVSSTLDLINEEPDPSETRYWHRFISERTPQYELSLVDDPGVRQLSQFEESIVSKVFEQFGHMNKWALRDYTHTLPEYVDPKGSRLRISIRSVLEAEGFDAEEAEGIERALEHDAEVEAHFYS